MEDLLIIFTGTFWKYNKKSILWVHKEDIGSKREIIEKKAKKIKICFKKNEKGKTIINVIFFIINIIINQY